MYNNIVFHPKKEKRRKEERKEERKKERERGKRMLSLLSIAM
jgi:hypothetical protein